MFYDEIRQQPDALRACAEFYGRAAGAQHLRELAPPRYLLLTGMGASFHAALYMSYLLQTIGIAAEAHEATDLLNYGAVLLDHADGVLFVSQSGSSAEILPLLEQLQASKPLVAVTNQVDSPLARGAQHVLPLMAGAESMVATKTYLNSLACLWMLSQHWRGRSLTDAAKQILLIADEIERLVEDADALFVQWLSVYHPGQPLLLLGHGPHGITARHTAMMLSEWAKELAFASSIGAFRHGLIEAVNAGTGVIVFGASGMTSESVKTLVTELTSYGASILSVRAGRAVGAVSQYAADDFLSPLLDVIPAQLFAERLAREHGVAPGFRYISKVVSRL